MSALSPMELAAHPERRPAGMVTSAEIMAASGATYRQVHYWTRTGLLRAATDAGSGYVCWYPAAETAAARVLVRLIGAGLQPAKASVAARALLASGRVELAPGLWLVADE